MNPISKIVADIRFAIPIEILNAAFYRPEFGRALTPVTVDDLIRERVIEAKVRQDCNLVGGTEALIPLQGLSYDAWDTYRFCYKIPRIRTNGLAITRVVSVVIGNMANPTGTYMGQSGYSQPLASAQDVLSSVSSIPLVATTDVQLVGPNMVLVSDLTMSSSQLYLRCFLENDADFNNLRGTVVQRFSEMCLLAVKAYIYNTLKIKVDQGQLVGGMNIGAFREIIDSYADAHQMYHDFLLNKWKKLAIFNDPMAKKRHVRMLMSGGR